MQVLLATCVGPTRRGSETDPPGERDVIVERGDHSKAVEVKSAATPSIHFFDALEAFRRLNEEAATGLALEQIVVYAGATTQRRRPGRLLSWREIDDIDW